MIKSYKLGATVTFNHEYYPESQLQHFQLTPSPDTQRYLDVTGLQLKQTGNQLSIYYSLQNQGIEPLQVLKSLIFYFASLDPYFLNFTDLPIKEQEGNFVFYNNQEDSNLSIGAFVSEHDLSTAYVDDHFNPQTQLGVIKLDLSIPGNDQTPPSYQLNFAARKTIWRYFLINNSGQEFADLNIEATGINVDFSDEGERELSNGQKARLLSSEGSTPIALSAVPTFKFNLNSGSKTIIKGLPSPEKNVIFEKDGDAFKAYSDMYIYL